MCQQGDIRGERSSKINPMVNSTVLLPVMSNLSHLSTQLSTFSFSLSHQNPFFLLSRERYSIQFKKPKSIWSGHWKSSNIYWNSGLLPHVITKLTLTPVKYEPSEKLVHTGKLCYVHSHKDLELLPMASWHDFKQNCLSPC